MGAGREERRQPQRSDVGSVAHSSEDIDVVAASALHLAIISAILVIAPDDFRTPRHRPAGGPRSPHPARLPAAPHTPALSERKEYPS